MKLNNSLRKALVSAIKKEIKSDANSTSCIFVFQPKVPCGLKKFSKLDNDK